jgi:hypothetical protein
MIKTYANDTTATRAAEKAIADHGLNTATTQFEIVPDGVRFRPVFHIDNVADGSAQSVINLAGCGFEAHLRNVAAGRKASATKGAFGHQVAALKARITRLSRTRDAITGDKAAKGMITKQIKAVEARLADLYGTDADAIAA